MVCGIWNIYFNRTCRVWSFVQGFVLQEQICLAWVRMWHFKHLGFEYCPLTSTSFPLPAHSWTVESTPPLPLTFKHSSQHHLSHIFWNLSAPTTMPFSVAPEFGYKIDPQILWAILRPLSWGRTISRRESYRVAWCKKKQLILFHWGFKAMHQNELLCVVSVLKRWFIAPYLIQLRGRSSLSYLFSILSLLCF